MYSIVQNCVLPRLSDEQRQNVLTNAALLSLHELFEAVPDPRSAHGLRYDLAFLLTCLLAALLCNCNSTEAIAQWCQEHQPLLRQTFGPRLFLAPSGSLYRRLLPRLSVEALEQVIGTWVQKTLVAPPDEPIALDGKTVRGARTANHVAPHLLSFRTHVSQETLFQISVSEKTNEIPVAQAILPLLPIFGRVCTADALHTHAEFMRLLHTLHADSLLTVKKNQPTLYADLETYFADPEAVYTQASTTDRARGRTEVRTIKVTTQMNAYLFPLWPYVAQVAQLTRTVTKRGQTTQEIVYLITSLSAQRATPECLLVLIRGHWSIENGLHSVRDVSFAEDRSSLSTGHAPQVMATFRNLAITLLHRQGTSQISATRRSFAYHPHSALSLLFSSPKGGQQ
jgi:predicted transposase YbfD/YdcC